MKAIVSAFYVLSTIKSTCTKAKLLALIRQTDPKPDKDFRWPNAFIDQ